jgi:hypothetical protein
VHGQFHARALLLYSCIQLPLHFIVVAAAGPTSKPFCQKGWLHAPAVSPQVSSFQFKWF